MSFWQNVKEFFQPAWVKGVPIEETPEPQYYLPSNIRKGAVLPKIRKVSLTIEGAKTMEANPFELEKLSFVVIDFETGNKNPWTACELAAVVVEDGIVVDQAEWRLNPKEYIEFSHIHGIRNEHVLHSPTFAEAFNDIRTFIEGRLVIAHNAEFDLGILKACCEKDGLPQLEFVSLCTLTMAICAYPYLPKYKLGFLAEILTNKKPDHSAINDVLATVDILMRICQKMDITSNAQLYSEFKKYAGTPTKKLISKRPSSKKLVPFPETHELWGKNICAAGPFERFDREYLVEICTLLNTTLSPRVAIKTDILIVGDHVQRDNKQLLKAQEIGDTDILTISELEFLKMLVSEK